MKMKYPKLDFGKTEAIVNKLGGMEGVQRFLSGVTVVNFKIWAKIKLGTFENIDGLKVGFMRNASRVCDWADYVMFTIPGFSISPVKKELSLVKVSKTDLGLEETSTDDEAIEKAKKLGLDLCPEEVGPQLRIQYSNQPDGERLRIAMKPIAGVGGHPHVFEVVNDGTGLWLGNESSNQKQSGHHLYSKYYLIFCIKEK
jgi:hypothetical protein